MRHALLVLMFAGLLASAAVPALAQGEFPLKYADARGNDPVLAMARRIVQPAPEKPVDLKALPKDFSGQAKYFSIPLGGKQVLAVVDASKPPKLYVDAAGTGDLSAAEPVPAGGPENLGMYGPVAIAGAGPQGQAARLRFHVLGDGQLMLVCPAGYVAGEAKLAGQTYRVAVVCNSSDGRYDRPLQLPLSRSAPPEFNIFAIDLNQDGKFDRSMPIGGEVAPLAKMTRIKDTYYSLKVAPDGSSVRIEKADPGMGTIDVGTPDAEMTALCDAGFQHFSGSGGKWQAPAGRYMVLQMGLAKTDAAGATWKLSGSGSGKLESFEIRPGETLALKIGPPLTVKVDAGPAGDGTVSLAMALEGQAGERYTPGAAKDNEDPSPPQFKILNEAGKVLTTGKFEFG